MVLLRNKPAWFATLGYLLAASVWIVATHARTVEAAPGEGQSFLEATWRSWILVAMGVGLAWTLQHLWQRTVRHQEEAHRRDETMAREREAQSRAILENAADAIISADEFGVIHQFNPAASRIFGHGEKEVLGRNIKMLIPRPYLPEHESYRAAAAAPDPGGEPAGIGREVWGRRKDGTRFPLELAVSEVKREPHRLFIAVARDITARKEAEASLEQSRQQLRSLAARLQAVREEERTRIAREIHDVLGQALTGVKMDLSWIKAHLPPAQPKLLERTAMMGELVDSTIQTVRKIATELRPGVLDNLGLVAALEWQAEEFQARTGIHCQCHSSLDESVLEPSHQTALFRIFQETLTNVARHAQATQVEARLNMEDGGIALKIEDNGRGITAQEMTGASSLGLLGIRERAAMLGGTVAIDGRRGAGTVVTTRIPATAQFKGSEKTS